MGLDTTHDAWHGAYSAFHRFRTKIAEAAGLPPLELMEGFFHEGQSSEYSAMTYCAQRDQFWGKYVLAVRDALPIRWDWLKPDPLHTLLYHSDCDGDIAPEDCAKIAARLEELLPILSENEGAGHIPNWRDKTRDFINGLRRAAAANEPLEFH